MTLLALATLALLGSCLASLTPAFGPLSWDVVVFLDLFDFFIIPTAIPLSLPASARHAPNCARQRPGRYQGNGGHKAYQEKGESKATAQ